MRSGIAGERIAWCLAACWFVATAAWGQNNGARTPEIWQKDVVVLVDVSGSVDPSASLEARDIIEELVQARYNKTGWADKGWTPEPSSYPYFQQILNGVPGSLPLMRARKFLMVMQIGELETVRSTFHVRPIMRFPENFVSSLRSAYPREWRDPWTHYRLAQARAYERMRETANAEGYYLFVVSDAEDDPGPEKKRYDKVDQLYLRQWEQEKDKDEVLARIQYDVTRAKKKTMKRFFVLLYAVGFNPKETPPPRVEEPPPEPPVANQAAPRFEWLGGLAKTSEKHYKVFREPNPFLAWQVFHWPIEQRDFQVRITPEQGDRVRAESPKDVADTRIKLNELPDGRYKVEVHSPRDDPKVHGRAYIEVRRPKNYTLWISLASAVASLGVFGYAWWTLRQAA